MCDIHQNIAKWQGVNSLLVHYNMGGQASDGILKELRWNVDIQNSVTRKLLNETHGIFLDLQEACDDYGGEKEAWIKTSLEYRAVIQSCIIKLREKLKYQRERTAKESMENELNLLSIMEMIWHLCEVLLVQSQSGSYCLQHLLEWVRCHFNEADILGQNVMSSDDPYSHQDYWPTVYGFVLQGRLNEVCDLLMHHPKRDPRRFDAFASIEELLKKMPVFHVYQGQTMNDFNSKWQHWHSECASRLNDGDFLQYPQLQVLCELLCGDDAALLKQKDLFRSWYQLMAAKLLFADPTVKTFHLKQYAVECMEMYNGIGKVTPLDEIFLSIMAFDIHKVIEKCSATLPNWWFVAHLTDLLFHCGLLKSSNLDYGEELREFVILEYSASLMSHSSLWSIAADYLMTCPVNGREHLEAYLEKISLDSEVKALKVIRLCTKYGFTEQSNTVCKVMGMKALRRKRLGVALSWCLRAKDEVFASFLTEKFLNHYMETGTFAQCDLIENLGSSMLLNNKLTFLGKYHEFHKLYLSSQYRKAGALLVSLLTSNLAPKKFWMILLIDSLPLLENKEIIFTSEQTYELMQCLKELQLCYNPDVTQKRNKTIEEEEIAKVERLHFALTRNLGRALLVQSDHDVIR